YGFDIAKENFTQAGVQLATLTDYETLVKQALNSGFISEKQVDLLRNWRENPSEWGK
ncbi:MAG: orotate phosphoribosyltransferase, partial [Flavobacteriales bacterium]